MGTKTYRTSKKDLNSKHSLSRTNRVPKFRLPSHQAPSESFNPENSILSHTFGSKTLKKAKINYRNRISNTHRAKISSQLVSGSKSKHKKVILRHSKSLVGNSKHEIGMEINSERNYYENDHSMLPNNRRTLGKANFDQENSHKGKGLKSREISGFEVYIPPSFRHYQAEKQPLAHSIDIIGERVTEESGEEAAFEFDKAVQGKVLGGISSRESQLTKLKRSRSVVNSPNISK